MKLLFFFLPTTILGYPFEQMFIKPDLPMWYPLAPLNHIKKKLNFLVFDNLPLVGYQKTNNSFIVHSDICPHQGASLAKKGWINENNNLQCGYHGFEFCDGSFCKIPNPIKDPKYFTSKIKLPLFPAIKKQDLLFFSPNEANVSSLPDIFYPPEEYDNSFRYVEGSKLINANYMTVCENLLDMLHISYVHTFGSRETPIPFDIKSKRLGEYSFQTQFLYHPNTNTISKKVGRVENVLVQNEYHLPPIQSPESLRAPS